MVSIKQIHEHDLKYVEDIAAAQDGDAEWCCNGVEIFKEGCKSGQEDIGVHLLSKCWRSVGDDADFDMCETCIQWVLFCNSTGADLGIGNLEELEAKGIELSEVDESLRKTLTRSSTIIAQ